MNRAPLHGLTTTPTHVTTRYQSNAAGRSVIVVRCNGQQRTIPTNLRLSGMEKHTDAIRTAFAHKNITIKPATSSDNGRTEHWNVSL